MCWILCIKSPITCRKTQCSCFPDKWGRQGCCSQSLQRIHQPTSFHSQQHKHFSNTLAAFHTVLTLTRVEKSDRAPGLRLMYGSSRYSCRWGWGNTANLDRTDVTWRFSSYGWQGETNRKIQWKKKCWKLFKLFFLTFFPNAFQPSILTKSNNFARFTILHAMLKTKIRQDKMKICFVYYSTCSSMRAIRSNRICRKCPS